ncbi:hypothetical protein F0562_029316 [Nyssa sinensis]|uniref:Uncharacterized protein n=1 Tax=Nyssa sinensis TaxID=561372 RepID=A0A5J5B2H6_9ASTE|nr:hypothetical protein F0562_029316 [Nyssa sinensis]
MGNPSLSIRVAFVLSLSLAASYTSSSHSSSSPLFFLKLHSSSTPPKPKASASDLLSLLGTPQQASAINPKEAQQLKSCFKFLVPFSPGQRNPESDTRSVRRTLCSKSINARNRTEEDERIWWPPLPVMELARLAVDSGGDPGAIHRALDPTVIPVPDIEGSKEKRCELTRTPYGRRFINEELNSYLEFLFEIIVDRGPSIGLNISLNRYDFFHGHIFLATDSGRLGILFHAKEYPAYEKKVFPYNMGYCQRGSNVPYDDSMNLRNILWLAPLPSNSTKDWLAPGVLVVLDAHPGGIIYRDLIPEYVNYVRTIYEDDLGDVVADVNYLNVGGAVPDYQIFIC